jgi:hypothetical protein
VEAESAGYLALAVGRSGFFSGNVLLAGARYGFSGQLNSTGDAAITVRRRFLPSLSLSLHVDVANGTDQLSGSVSGGAWTSEVAGNRNVFNARLNPAPQAGLRFFTLQQTDSADSSVAGTSRISKAGIVSVRGKIGDRQRFMTSSSLAENGDYPFYLSLNHGTELVIGWLNFPAAREPAAGGSVVWSNTGTNAFARSLQVSSSSLGSLPH